MESSEQKNIIQKLLIVFKLPKAFKDFQNLDKEKRSKLSKIEIDPDLIKLAKDYKLSDWKKNILNEVKNYFEPLIRDENKYYLPSDIINKLRAEIINYYGGQEKVSEKLFQKLILPICSEMQNYISKESALIKGMDRVKKLLSTNAKFSEKEIKIEENPNKGANDSFIARIEGETYYIKNCSNDSHILGDTKGKVHPNELLVYKVMEYAGFGPKTEFLFGRYSSSGGNSSSHKGNYIMTKDLNEKDKKFLMDIEENCQEFKNALQNEDFSVELSASSALNDLLSLTDTFGRNTRNYGLVVAKTKELDSQEEAEEEAGEGDEIKKYKIQFVDHLPNANNGLFSLSSFKPEEYSPRAVLEKKSNSPHLNGMHSAFKDLAVNRESFKKIILDKQVNERLNSFREVLDNAQNEISSLIIEYPENFIEGAKDELNKYLDKVNKNLEAYNKTNLIEKNLFNLKLYNI